MMIASPRLFPYEVNRGKIESDFEEINTMNEPEILQAARQGISETQRPRRILRSIGAVFAGLITIVILSTATDMVMQATGIFPQPGQRMPDALFVLPTAYRIVSGILGCYITARFAVDRPMRHALVLGAIGFVLSIAGAAAMWDAGPAWYSIAIIAITVPCAWLGARLRGMQLSARPAVR